MMMHDTTNSITNKHKQTNRSLRRWALGAGAPVAAAAVAMTVGAWAPREFGGEIPLADARMIIEFNDTDQDIGIQMFIDGEPWKRLQSDDHGQFLQHVSWDWIGRMVNGER